MLFARAHRFSPLWPDDRDRELEAGLERLRTARASGDADQALSELREAVAARLEVGERIRKRLRDPRLVAELEPWLVCHAHETRNIGRALDLLAALNAGGTKSQRAMAFFGFEGGLTREPGNGRPLPLARVALDGPKGIRPLQADQNGRFSFDRVVPGEYRICAWTDIDPDLIADEASWEAAGCEEKVIPVAPDSEVEIDLTATP